MTGDRLDEQLARRDGSAADDNLVGANVQLVGQGINDGGRREVGVSVGAFRRIGDRVKNTGSGGNGDSFDDSLKVCSPPAARRPGL